LPELADTLPVAELIASAEVVWLVAHDAFTGVLSAHPRYADPGKAIEAAVRSVLDRNVIARTGLRITVPCAFIAVIVAHDACAEVAHAIYTHAGKAIEVAGRSVGH
jgi:hypothetical protein